MRLALAVIAVLAVLPLQAQDEASSNGQHEWCGTSRETTDAVRELALWTQSRERLRAAAKSPALTMSDDVIVIEPDDSMIPFDHPSDLEGTTIHFRRTSGSSFGVHAGALEYEGDVGSRAATFQAGASNEYHLHRLQSFEFPFRGRRVRDLYISERFGIFLAAPQDVPSGLHQLGPLDVVASVEPVIAPYLEPGLPRTLSSAIREVFIRETGDAVIVTWRASLNPNRPYDPLNHGAVDIQAVLERSGDIRFSYRTVDNLGWGAVAVSSGDEASRTQFGTLVSLTDPTGDSGGSSAYRDLLDIRTVEVRRVAGSEWLQIRVALSGRLSPETVPGNILLRSRLSSDNDSGEIVLTVRPGSWRYCVPGWGCTTSGANVTFATDAVTMNVLERYIPMSGHVELVVGTSASGVVGDSASGAFDLSAGTSVETDFSTLAGEEETSRPVLEAFTLPPLNPEAVWNRIREELDLLDAEVDAVAIHQNFDTDLRQWATAYSTVGNSGADGVWAESEDFYGSALPLAPALLHMNRVEPHRTDEARLRWRRFLLGHELGHRWLYGFQILENGQPSYVLNPSGGHPAAYVHTPAAFSVYTPTDYSVMGGSRFLDHGDGSFSTPDDLGAYGYSWHELYLMGLAGPEEVEPWFYIADSDPPLPDAYNADPLTHVTGRRADVELSGLVGAMGRRFPEAIDSPRQFRVLFVLLSKPSPDSAAEETVLKEHAASFPPFFSAATGGRGSVITTLPLPPAADFTWSRAQPAVGEVVSFRDASANYPVSWSWDFGDGSTSTERFPRHHFQAAGRHSVTLRVENSRGASSRAIEVDVTSGGPRRRAATR